MFTFSKTTYTGFKALIELNIYLHELETTFSWYKQVFPAFFPLSLGKRVPTPFVEVCANSRIRYFYGIETHFVEYPVATVSTSRLHGGHL